MNLSQGVVLLDKAPQSLLDDMGVDLRGRDICMTQKLLHGAQIRPPLQQMTGKSMAQHMRRNPRRLDASGKRECLQLLAEALPRQMLCSVAGGEQPPRPGAALRLVGGKRRAMIRERLAGGIVERHEALASAFALDGHDLVVAGQHVAREPEQLRDAKTGGVERLEQSIDAKRPPLGRAFARLLYPVRRGFKQRLDFGQRQQFRQWAPELRTV